MAQNPSPSVEETVDAKLAELAEGYRPLPVGDNDAKQTYAIGYIAYALGELLKEVRQLRAALDGEATARLR